MHVLSTMLDTRTHETELSDLSAAVSHNLPHYAASVRRVASDDARRCVERPVYKKKQITQRDRQTCGLLVVKNARAASKALPRHLQQVRCFFRS